MNGLLDVSRITFKENSDDAISYVSALEGEKCNECTLWRLMSVKEEHGMKLELKYDNLRQFYIRLSQSDLQGRNPPEEFVNVILRKGKFECSTLTLMKRNQKVSTLW